MFIVLPNTQLRDIWIDKITASSASNAGVEMEVMSWLSRATLDIIGIAGFAHQIDALQNGEQADQLSSEFSKMLEYTTNQPLLSMIRERVPPLRWIVSFL